MRNRYYQWLVSLVCDQNYDSRYYSKLLYQLDGIEFTWSINLDEDRASDGIRLRERFGKTSRSSNCSVLEMMVALACRIEGEYLEDGSANAIFWGMIKSLGLYFNDDYNYDADLTDAVIENLLNRTYRKDGKGGLFTVKHPREDLRDVPIWMQAMWYIAELG